MEPTTTTTTTTSGSPTTKAAHEEVIGEDVPSTLRKERRNGMWNIFEGVMEASVLEKLGLSEDLIAQLTSARTEADDNVSDHLTKGLTTPDPSPSQSASLTRPGVCGCCERSRLQRSFSASVGEEVRAALQNRQRRNAVGNLFEALSPSQQLLLVDILQEKLKKLTCLCNGGVSAAGAEGDGSGDVDGRGGDCDIFLAAVRSELSAVAASTASSSAGGSSTVSSARAQGEIVCR